MAAVVLRLNAAQRRILRRMVEAEGLCHARVWRDGYCVARGLFTASSYEESLRLFRRLKHREPERYQTLLSAIVPEAPRPEPLPLEFEGRAAHHWIESICEYLAWRSGVHHRPLRDRFAPDVTLYHQCNRLIRDAQLVVVREEEEGGLTYDRRPAALEQSPPATPASETSHHGHRPLSVGQAA